MNIVEAGNTMCPRLFVLKDKGYNISYNDNGDIIAFRGDDTFCASSAAALLGLVVMYETRGASWAEWTDKDNRDIVS